MCKLRPLAIGFLLAQLVMAITWSSASAAGGRMAADLSPGPGLTVSGLSTGTFLVPATQSEGTVYASLGNYEVSDSTGSGAGWHLVFQLLGISCSRGKTECVRGQWLDADATMWMRTPSVSCILGTDCSGRASPPTIPQASDIAFRPGTAVEVASAVRTRGMGAYVFHPRPFREQGDDLALSVPGQAGPDTLSPSLVASVVSGP